jgi:hypothetical protein
MLRSTGPTVRVSVMRRVEEKEGKKVHRYHREVPHQLHLFS